MLNCGRDNTVKDEILKTAEWEGIVLSLATPNRKLLSPTHDERTGWHNLLTGGASFGKNCTNNSGGSGIIIDFTIIKNF